MTFTAQSGVVLLQSKFHGTQQDFVPGDFVEDGSLSKFDFAKALLPHQTHTHTHTLHLGTCS